MQAYHRGAQAAAALEDLIKALDLLRIGLEHTPDAAELQTLRQVKCGATCADVQMLLAVIPQCEGNRHLAWSRVWCT